MALINCPECGKEVSDKAPACIHCGCPLESSAMTSTNTSYDIEDKLQSITNHIVDWVNNYVPLTDNDFDGMFENVKMEVFSIYEKTKDCSDIEKKNINYEIAIAMFTPLFEKHTFFSGANVKRFCDLINFSNIPKEKFETLSNLSCETLGLKNGFTAHMTFFWLFHQIFTYGTDYDALKLKECLNKADSFGVPKIKTVNEYINETIAEESVQAVENEVESNVPKCPTCGSININKISALSKAGNVAMWGVLSRKVHKQWHCNNCGSEW